MYCILCCFSVDKNIEWLQNKFNFLWFTSKISSLHTQLGTLYPSWLTFSKYRSIWYCLEKNHLLSLYQKVVSLMFLVQYAKKDWLQHCVQLITPVLHLLWHVIKYSKDTYFWGRMLFAINYSMHIFIAIKWHLETTPCFKSSDINIYKKR